MPLHFSIPSGLVQYVNQELAAYHQSMRTGDLQTAWRHLERAHILGQSSPYQHTRIHWKMLIFAFRIGRETYRKMIQNLIWATAYNSFSIPLAAGVLYSYGIMMSPAVGAVLMSLSTVIVAINAQLLKRKIVK